MCHFILAGSGRSGTTWIGEALSSCRGGCLVYEPLRASMVPQVPTFGRAGEHPAPYVSADSVGEAWEHFFRLLLGGRISNCWTRQDWHKAGRRMPWLPDRVHQRVASVAHCMRQKTAHHCVIKAIRANLLLGWLSRRFPVRVVYLTRHPCAVVGSRLRLQWSDVLGEVVSQPALVEDYLGPYWPHIENARTPLQRMTAHWCIENLVPLRQLEKNPGWIAMSYEAFVAGGEKAFAELFGQLGLRPSGVTSEKIRVRESFADARNRASWHHPLSEREGMEVLDICRGFGIGLYGRDFLPLSEHRAALC